MTKEIIAITHKPCYGSPFSNVQPIGNIFPSPWGLLNDRMLYPVQYTRVDIKTSLGKHAYRCTQRMRHLQYVSINKENKKEICTPSGEGSGKLTMGKIMHIHDRPLHNEKKRQEGLNPLVRHDDNPAKAGSRFAKYYLALKALT